VILYILLSSLIALIPILCYAVLLGLLIRCRDRDRDRVEGDDGEKRGAKRREEERRDAVAWLIRSVLSFLLGLSNDRLPR